MSHFYDNGKGGKYPSVTTILHDGEEPIGIKIWKKNNKDWEAQLKRKAIIGTVSHYRILKRFSPGVLQLPDNIRVEDFPDDLHDKAELAECMFNNLKLELQPPHFPEYTVICHEYRYAGQLDLMSTLIGNKHPIQGRILFDIKTSNAVYDTYGQQLAAYKYAWEEMHPREKVAGAAILNIHPFPEKNPKLEPKLTFFTLDDLKEPWEKFKIAAEQYHNRRT